MRMRSLFSLYVLFTIIYWMSKGEGIASIHFYNCFKAISLASFIKILFIYKWHARNFNVSFLGYNITIQYGRGD